MDFATVDWSIWITFAGHNNADSRFAGLPFQFDIVQLAIATGFNNLVQIGVEHWENDLSFWIAESTVELQSLRAVFGQHQTSIQNAAIFNSLVLKLGQCAFDNFFAR